MELGSIKEVQGEVKRRGLRATIEQLEDILYWSPPYGEGDVKEVIQKLEQGSIRVQVKKNQSEPVPYKKARAQLRDWIEKRERSLWQRSGYQQDLDGLADMFPSYKIPKEGFATWNEADAFVKWVFNNKLWDYFEHRLIDIVEKYANKRLGGHSSSRLQLDSDWFWVVFNHLLRREEGREVARFMVEQEYLPHVKTLYDKWSGEEIGTELSGIKPKTSEPIIREAKKYLKNVKRKIQAATKAGQQERLM